MKKKGFTLIELLAVIVILAIIALIASPIVIGIIEDSRLSAAERSAESYLDAVETAIMKSKLKGDEIVDGTYTIGANGSLTLSSKTYQVPMDGTVPASGGKITITDGKVTGLTNFKVGDYTVALSGGKLTASKGETYDINKVLTNVVDDTSTINQISKNGEVTLKFSLDGSGSCSFVSPTVTGATHTWNNGTLVLSNPTGNVTVTVKANCTSCFVAGTKVLTESGFKNIEDIVVGEKVYTRDLDTNQTQLKSVINTIVSDTKITYLLTIGNKEVEVTPRHQLYIIDRGWVRTYDVAVGDVMLDKDGNPVEITNIVKKEYEESIPTYNLSIEGNHNYFVTEIQVLVHNALPSAT